MKLKIYQIQAILFSVLLCFLSLKTYSTNQSVSGTISVNTTWSAVDTIKITGDVTINSGVTLTINPGMVVISMGHYLIKVNGRILANGTKSGMIKFTAVDTVNGWNGIEFRYTNVDDTSKFYYCILEWGKTMDIYPNGGAMFIATGNDVVISNCIFRNNYSISKGGAIYSSYFVKILNSEFYNNGAEEIGKAVYINGSFLMKNCLIHDNLPGGNNEGAFTISGDSSNILNTTVVNNGGLGFYLNNAKVRFENCIIYGNSNSQINISTTSCRLYFSYCDIRRDFYIHQGTCTFENCIDANPLFTGTGNTPYVPVSSSPCADAGNPNTSISDVGLYDINGTFRFRKGIVDIGASEVQATMDNIPGKCLNFDGTNDWVNIGNAAALNTGSTFTIESWVKPVTLSGRFAVYSTRRNNSSGAFQLEIGTGNGGTGRVAVTGKNTWIAETGNNAIKAGEWTHIVYTRSGSGNTNKIYINGEEQTLVTNVDYTFVNNTSDKEIGAGMSGDHLFKGRIDELRLWNLARTIDEIRENMHLPLSGSEAGLVSNWQFNEGSGSYTDDIVSDILGALNNMGAASWVSSSIPFGGGESATRIAESTLIDFTGTDLLMNIYSHNSQSITVTKINQKPNLNPDMHGDVFDSQYWTINSMLQLEFNADLIFKVNEDLTQEDVDRPYNIKLYRRSLTSDNEWIYAAEAISVRLDHKNVTFSHISDEGQFIICRSFGNETPHMVLLEGQDVFQLNSDNFGSITYMNSSAPSVTDFDGDGLLDLVVGSGESSLKYFEQTSSHAGTFASVLDPFINERTSHHLTPVFADLDGDGLFDLLVGTEEGNILHYEQPSQNSVNFTLITLNFNSITGSYTAPAITDIDNDRKLDLLVGTFNGAIAHYEQNAVNSLTFTLVSGNFNGINAGTRPCPVVNDFDSDGLLDLLVGNSDGVIYYYRQDSVNSLLFTLVTGNFNTINVGNNCKPAITDIDDDGAADLITGMGTGKLNRYEQVRKDTVDLGAVHVGRDTTIKYFVKANGLTSGLALESPDHFSISLNAQSGFTRNITFTPEYGKVGSDIYIRYTPDAFTDFEGNLTFQSGNLPTEYVLLKGTGCDELESGEISSEGETVCPNSNPSVINSITSAGRGDGENYVYRWQSSTDSLFSSPETIPNSNSVTYDPPTGINVNTWYRRQAHDLVCNPDFQTSDGVWKVTIATNYPGVDCNCIVNIPDANFKTALLEIAGIDANQDGIIHCWEAEAFAGNINVSDKNISDLTGIETFKNIPVLYCNDNSLSTLDLTANRNLTSLRCYNNLITDLKVDSLNKLKYMYCYNNRLTSLNLSGDTALINLNCNYNSITNLNVSGAIPLINLYCRNNSISELDLSTNTALEIIRCENNALNSFNVKNGMNVNITDFYATGNPDLSCIQVDDAAYSTANWPYIDPTAQFSNDCTPPCFVNIPDENFKNSLLNHPGLDANGNGEIDCSEAENYSGDIDVSDQNIFDLTGIEHFLNITVLNCNHNSLSTIDLSSNMLIKELFVDENNLTSMDLSANTALEVLSCGINELIQLNLTGLINLKELYCNDNSLSTLDLTTNTGIEKLQCQYNNITQMSIDGLNNLRFIYCMNNNLSQLIVTGLLSLENIYCYDNQLTALDISTNTGLKKLVCRNNALNSLNVQNGNNSVINEFDATGNPGLNCIQVDDVAYSEANWTNIDTGAYFSTDCNACYVNIPDANFKAALLEIAGLDADGDGEIDCSEAENFRNDIDVSERDIEDITGIEHFVNISYFNCSSNIISFLDASDCINLQHLECYDNLLTSLDLSANTNLVLLNCNYNSLSYLNVNACIYLETIFCHDNQLTTLDLSTNTNLQLVHCYINNLSFLNLQNGNNNRIITNDFYATDNPGLNCIQVDDVAYSEANWTNIDPGAYFSTDCNTCYVNIPDANFKAVLLSNEEINLNGNGEIECWEANDFTGEMNVCCNNISDLSGIESFVNMTGIDCSYNSISSVDFSHNTNLTELYCNDNQLVNLDLSSNILLENVECSSNLLTNLNVSGLDNLLYFYCSNNQLINLDLLSNTNLEYLECRANSLTNLDVSGLPVIYNIECAENQLTSLDLSANTNLVSLNCNYNSLSYLNVNACIYLETIYCNNNQLTVLDLSSNPNLVAVDCEYNALNSLSVKNGNNVNIIEFYATSNPDLNCIQVDDAAYSDANWTIIDPWANFSTNCSGAGAFIWEGNVSDDWSEPLNWNTETVPGAGDDVVIPSGTSYSPVVYTAVASPASCNDINVENGAVLTVAAGKALTINGNAINNGTLEILSDASGTGSLLHHTDNLSATFKQYIATETWNLISTPFRQGPGATSGDLIPAGGEAYFRPYNDGTGWGDYITPIDYQLLSLNGYALWLTQQKTLSFTGLLNNGTMDRQLVTGPSNNWNLTGNPYPSSVDWEQLDRTNTTESIYLWENDYAGSNSGNYMTYNASSQIGVPASVTGIIPPFQGFFVEATSAGTLQFSNDARLHSELPLYKSTGQTEVLARLKVSDSQGRYDELAVCSNPEASDLFDLFDSRKFAAGSDAPEIYTVCSNEPLVINTLQGIPAVIPVNITIPANGSGVCTLKTLDLIHDSGVGVKLEDILLGTMTDLRTHPEINLSLASGGNNNRFFLHIGAAAGIAENENPSLLTVVNDNQIHISVTGNMQMTKVALYDMTGREVYVQKCSNNRCIIATESFTQGVYILKAEAGKTMLTRKININ